MHIGPDLPDHIMHYALVGLGLFLASMIKVGFDYLAKTFWKKIDHASEDYKAFKAWQKAGAPKVS